MSKSCAPRILHQKVVTCLSCYLVGFVDGNDPGQILVSPVDVFFSEFDVVEPDIIYVSKQRATILTEKNVQEAPDLVVEVLSEWTAKIDRTSKLKRGYLILSKSTWKTRVELGGIAPGYPREP
jgi:Uma2 family endonuclease